MGRLTHAGAVTPVLRFLRRCWAPLLGALVLVCAVGIIGAIGTRALAPGAAGAFDAEVSIAVLEQRADWLTTTAGLFSRIADLAVVMVGALVLAALGGRRRWPPLAAWVPVLATAGGLVVSSVVKVLTARARPDAADALVQAVGMAFPSGHALRAAAFYGAAAWLVTRGAAAWAAALVWTAAGLVVVLVSLTRVYLGVHWFSDVAGGVLLGGLWLMLLVGIVRHHLPPGAGSRAERGDHDRDDRSAVEG